MVSKIAVSVVAGLVCGVFLNIFYLSLRHVWPENYFGLAGSVDPVVSRNLPRWAIFRLIPPAIAAAAAALTTERAGGYLWVAAGVTTALHARLLVGAVVISVRRKRRAAAFEETLVALAILAIMTVGTLARRTFAPIIPRPEDLVSNIWAGFLAAIAAVYLQQVVLLRKEPRDLVGRSFDEIPMRFKVEVWRRARTTGIDPLIPLAVMAAENLQRPSWVRRLEQLIPRQLGGTRGIMQQQGARDDLHSIALAFERNFQDGAAARSPWTVFSEYNPASEFRDLAYAAHLMLMEDQRHTAAIQQAAQEAA